jgi:multidrug efflux pump
VEDSVTQIIEQKLTGLDGLLYMKSTSDSYGNASTTLTFSAGTDPDIAQVQVQNKLQTGAAAAAAGRAAAGRAGRQVGATS